MPPRLREVVARQLEQLDPFDERLLAALAVVDDGFTQAELAALAGAGVDEALGEAEAVGVLSVRGRYRFPARARARQLAARLPEKEPAPRPRGGGAACQ